MKVDADQQKPTSKASAAIDTTTTRLAVTTQGAAAARVTRTNTLGLVKKKSCTTLLCELTRLKSQQKYLECSQVKLNPANYEDPTASNGSAAFPLPPLGGEAMQLVNEIECLKVQLDEDLKVYSENSYREVEEFRDLVSAIRVDVQQPERLSQYTLPVLRERIIAINTQLMQLCDKNQAEMEKLRGEFEQLERNNDILVKI
ncbi:uncharacterized protein LOC128868713 [Anastrepha ludens]|uniref:uncharacterized protein LOC128868713 n=1 Tax=Anastrepha ludens TaxID=28586 RepID=UPI0023AF564A|nr:uncharacterized protein LOC128868713 [Anastrepha ludens]